MAKPALAEKGGASGAPAPTGHSRFGASNSERWLNCHGSVRAEAQFPNQSSDYAQEGTALHAVAALCLTNNQDALEYVDRVIEGVEITEEHAEAVQDYLDVVRADKKARGGKLLIEQRFHLNWLHPEFFGTGDCCTLGTDNILRVYDAKFGRGKLVEAVKADGSKNPQLSYYGLGAVERLKAAAPALPINGVELIVVQPRAYHKNGPVRRVATTHAELLDLAQDLVEAAKAADSPNPRFAVGEWCQFCRAAGACKTFRGFATDMAQLDFDDEAGVVQTYGEKTTNPLSMTEAEIARVLDAADLIDAWIKAVRYHAFVLADSGRDIPGFKLVDKRAVRKWRDETAAASELQLVYGLDATSIFSQKLLSPAQIEKLLPKPDRPALADLYDKTSSGKTLTRSTSDRPEAKASAQADFDDEHATAQAVEW